MFKVTRQIFSSFLNESNLNFHQAFAELNALSDATGKRTFSELRVELAKAPDSVVFEAFGLKFPAQLVTAGGILSILSVQLYFFAYLRLVDGAAGGAERKALARRKSAAALDRRRTLGSREEVPTYQRLSRNLVAEGTPESVAHSAEGGPGNRSRLNSVAGSLTVPNIESRCNQLKLGHPPPMP